MAIDVWDHSRYRIVSTGDGPHQTNIIKHDGKIAINNNSRKQKYCNKTIDIQFYPRCLRLNCNIV